MTAVKPPGSTAALSLEQATQLARDTIAKQRNGSELALLDTKTVETAWGWVFHYTTKRFLETGDRNELVPGMGPFVVERDSGRTTFLSTSVPPDRALTEYERTRTRRR